MLQFSESAGLRELLERKIEQVSLQRNESISTSVGSANQGFFSPAQHDPKDEEDKPHQSAASSINW